MDDFDEGDLVEVINGDSIYVGLCGNITVLAGDMVSVKFPESPLARPFSKDELEKVSFG